MNTQMNCVMYQRMYVYMIYVYYFQLLNWSAITSLNLQHLALGFYDA